MNALGHEVECALHSVMDYRVVFLGNDRRPVQGLSQMSVAGLPGTVHPGLGSEFGATADGGTRCALPGSEAGEGGQLASRGESAPVADFGHENIRSVFADARDAF